MKHNEKRIAVGMLAATILLSGCGGGKTGKLNSDIDLSTYPIDTDVKLTYWCDLTTNASATVANFGETEFSKELEKRTGISVEYLHPAQGQGGEAFSLMIASNDLPDMIYNKWNTVLGSPQAAIDDGVIIGLNDMVNEYAPNLKNYLEANSEIDKMTKTDDGKYYVFPFIRGDDKLLISNGPVIRKDWLDELGLKEPTTVSELEETLIAFRDKKGAVAPLSVTSGETSRLFYIFSANSDFYVDNGVVKYGPCEEEYKQALVKLQEWFKQGLLDNNYFSNDSKIVDANILNGKTGVTYGSGGSGLGKWLESIEKENTGFDLMALSYISADGSDLPAYIPAENYFSGFGAAITSACAYPELASKFLDYSYSEDGSMLNNFGIEGESYTMIDGKPIYTDEIMKNSEGLSISQAMARYIRACNNAPFVQDKGYIDQYYVREQQKEALNKWTKGYQEVKLKIMPPITLTAEESEEFVNIMADVTKSCNEFAASVISGIKSVDEYEGFKESIGNLNIKRALEIQQAAYDRYMKR